MNNPITPVTRNTLDGYSDLVGEQSRRINNAYIPGFQQPHIPAASQVSCATNPFTSSDDKCRQILQSMNAVRLYKQVANRIERSMAGDWYQMAQNGLYVQGFHQQTDVHQIPAELAQMNLDDAPEGIKDVVAFINKTLKELGITE